MLKNHLTFPADKPAFWQVYPKNAGNKTTLFRPKAMVVGNKNKKVENFF
jgi:hypothetical protein